MRLVACLLAYSTLALAPAPAAASDDQDQRAKQLYATGKSAYNEGNYQAAYDAFKESFRLSHQPALLYNVASALQGLGRPHDAAEALRSFLRLQPNDPDKPQIEERIRTLEEEQRLLDLERKPAPAPVAIPAPPPAPTPKPLPSLGPSEPLAVQASAPVHDHRKRNLIIGITVAGAVVVAAVAIGLAFGLQPTTDPLSPANVGPLKGTQ